MNLPELCPVCDQPFTATDWADRHTDPDGADVHPSCCVICHPELDSYLWNRQARPVDPVDTKGRL